MSAATIAQPNRSRQLLSFTGDRTRKMLSTKAKRATDAALARDHATAALIDYLYRQGTPDTRAEAERLNEEVRRLYALARAANDRVSRYNQQHPIESY